MLTDHAILVVEDNVYLALDLAAAIEQLEGRVVGPVDTVSEALALLDSAEISAAIIDAELPDKGLAQLASTLADRRVPFVIQTSGMTPAELTRIKPGAPVLTKPIRTSEVAVILAREVAKANEPNEQTIK
jgi:DNA-binding NtrC family response regulator